MEQNTVQDFLTEIVDLPSLGLLYPEGHPLASGKVEMRYMTAKDEDILTNLSYIENGVVLDRLISMLCITKFNLDDIVIGDKNMLLIAARILGYGADYTFKWGEDDKATINLTELTKKTIDLSLFTELPGGNREHKNEFTFELPTSKVKITFKIITQKDEKDIEAELKGLEKIHQSAEITTRLKYSIVSVNGQTDKAIIRSFVDKMLARDSMALRKYMSAISPDINTNIAFTTEKGRTVEGANMPISADFFWPST